MTARGLIVAASLLGGAVAYGESHAESSSAVLVAPFISGSTVYSARQLSSVYSAQIGKPTDRSIAPIVASIEARYREDGFVAPIVTVDGSADLSATPRLQIHEATLADVRLRGDAGPGQAQLLKYVDSLAAQHPLRTDRTREILSSIQRLPGVGVRAAFEPSPTGVNRFTLVLEVAYHPITANVGAANRGTRASGRELVSGRLSLNGLLGRREFLTVEGAASTAFDQYHYAGFGATRAFGSTWASVSISNAHARPWAASDIYERDRYALQVFTPAWESETLRLSSVVRLVAVDSSLKNDEFGPLSREHLRKIEIGGDLSDRSSSASRSRVAATLIRGVAGLGASASSYDDVPPSDPVFTKLILNGEHALTLPHDIQLTGRFVGEYGFDAVPNSEQFTFGGTRFGRGLEAADLAGQHGAAVSLDVEHPSPWRTLWMDSTTLYTGIDYGYAWTTNAGVVRDHAASTSVGLTVERAAFNSSFELAYPLHRPHFAETDDGIAAFIELEWRL
jgi:hemolysin activation/secretion protein